MTVTLCPLCGADDTSRSISICGGCHGRLQSLGSVAVASTGEFAAMNPEQADMLLEGGDGPRDDTPGAPGTLCTWCSKPHSQLRKLLSRGDAHICNECVALCADIMRAELGDSWNQ